MNRAVDVVEETERRPLQAFGARREYHRAPPIAFETVEKRRNPARPILAVAVHDDRGIGLHELVHIVQANRDGALMSEISSQSQKAYLGDRVDRLGDEVFRNG